MAAPLLLATVGCGGHPGAGAATSPAASQSGASTPSVAAKPTSHAAGVVATLELVQISGPDFSATLHFVHLDGSPISSYKLPNNTSAVEAGGDHVFFLESGHLWSVSWTGVAKDHGPVPGLLAQPPYWGGFVVSPDGSRWMWSVVDGAGSSLRSRLYVAGDGIQARLVKEESTPGSNQYLDPVLWSAAGVVIVNQPGNIGGFILFGDHYWWDSYLLDPVTMKWAPLSSQRDGCPFNDVSGDGTWTCTSWGPKQGGVVAVHRPGSGVKELVVEPPVFSMGDALISTDGSQIAVGMSHSDIGPDAVLDLGTVMFHPSTGRSARVGPVGDVPAAWLPDGALILQDEQPRDGYPKSRLDLLRPDGTVVRLGTGGFVGVLDPAGAIPGRTPAG